MPELITTPTKRDKVATVEISRIQQPTQIKPVSAIAEGAIAPTVLQDTVTTELPPTTLKERVGERLLPFVNLMTGQVDVVGALNAGVPQQDVSNIVGGEVVRRIINPSSIEVASMFAAGKERGAIPKDAKLVGYDTKSYALTYEIPAPLMTGQQTFDALVKSGDIPKDAVYKGYNKKTGAVSYETPAPVEPPTGKFSVTILGRTFDLWDVSPDTERTLQQVASISSLVLGEPLEKQKAMYEQTAGWNKLPAFLRDELIRAGNVVNLFTPKVEANILEDPGKFAIATGKAVASFIPLVWATDWDNLSTAEKVINGTIDCIILATMGGGAALSALRVRPLMNAARTANKSVIAMQSAIKAVQTVPFGSRRHAILANKAQVAINNSLRADGNFVSLLSKTTRLTSGQLSRLERTSGVRGLKSAITEVQKAQTQLTKAWATANKSQVSVNVASDEVRRLTMVAQRTGKAVDWAKVRRATAALEKADVNLTKAMQGVDPKAVIPMQQTLFGVPIQQVTRPTKAVSGVAQGQARLERALANFSTKLEPRYKTPPPTDEFKGFVMDWRRRIVPKLIEGEPVATPLHPGGRGRGLMVLEKTAPKVELTTVSEMRLRPAYGAPELAKPFAVPKVGVPRIKGVSRITGAAIPTLAAVRGVVPAVSELARAKVATATQEAAGLATTAALAGRTEAQIRAEIRSYATSELKDLTATHAETWMRAQTGVITDLAIEAAIENKAAIEGKTVAQVKSELKTGTLAKADIKVVTGLKVGIKVPPRAGKGKMRVLPHISLPAEEGKPEEKAIPKGSLAWAQGAFWKYIPPPWDGNKPRTLRKPPPGAVRTHSNNPQVTLQIIGERPAKVPKSFSVDLGVTDAFITSYGTKITFTGHGTKTNVGTRIASPTQGMSVGRGGVSRPEVVDETEQFADETAEFRNRFDSPFGNEMRVRRPVNRPKPHRKPKKRTGRGDAPATQVSGMRL